MSIIEALLKRVSHSYSFESVSKLLLRCLHHEGLGCLDVEASLASCVIPSLSISLAKFCHYLSLKLDPWVSWGVDVEVSASLSLVVHSSLQRSEVEGIMSPTWAMVYRGDSSISKSELLALWYPWKVYHQFDLGFRPKCVHCYLRVLNLGIPFVGGACNLFHSVWGR